MKMNKCYILTEDKFNDIGAEMETNLRKTFVLVGSLKWFSKFSAYVAKSF
jgi:hypothetical protein